EDEGLGVRVGIGGLGEVEGVAHEVCELYDLVALGEVAQDLLPVAEGFSGVDDHGVQLVRGGGGVALRQHALAGRGGREVIAVGGARPVGGVLVDLPGLGGQLGVAGAGLGIGGLEDEVGYGAHSLGAFCGACRFRQVGCMVGSSSQVCRGPGFRFIQFRPVSFGDEA